MEKSINKTHTMPAGEKIIDINTFTRCNIHKKRIGSRSQFNKYVVAPATGLIFLTTTAFPALAGGFGLKLKIPFGPNSRGKIKVSAFVDSTDKNAYHTMGDAISISKTNELQYTEISLYTGKLSEEVGLIDDVAMNTKLTTTEKVVLGVGIVGFAAFGYHALKDDDDNDRRESSADSEPTPPPGSD